MQEESGGGSRGLQAPPAGAGQTEPDPDIAIISTDPDVDPVSQRKDRRMTPHDLIQKLDLKLGSCGYMAKSYESHLMTQGDSLTSRSIGAALYFLITPDAGVRPHRILSDQIYHHYAGGPLEVLLLLSNGGVEQAVVGPDLDSDMRPQLLIPAGTFHLARLRSPATWALLGTTSWPAVAEGELEFTDAADLKQRYPHAADLIAAFAPAG
jgi:predicted cupin superfamily sugar epimerase